MFTNHGKEDGIYPLKRDSKAQNKDQQFKIYCKNMQKHTKKDLQFQLIEDIIVLLKMKLNHPSISTGQGNQLVSLLPSAP